MMPHYSAISAASAPKGIARLQQDGDGSEAAPGELPDTKGSSFSGGNAQKLALGRWLAGLRDIRLLLLDEPTQGVDVGSRAQIYNLLRKFAEQSPGRAALFATSEPEEAISLADRIIVLVNGQVKHVVEPSIGEAELMSLAQSVEVSHGVGH